MEDEYAKAKDDGIAGGRYAKLKVLIKTVIEDWHSFQRGEKYSIAAPKGRTVVFSQSSTKLKLKEEFLHKVKSK